MKRIFLLVWLQLLSAFAFTQIQGDVVDQNNKGIAGVIIIATDSLRNVIDTVKSDNRGFYSFNNLTPGNYKIQMKATGFKLVVIENILVKKDQTGVITGGDLYNGQRLDIILSPAKLP